MPHQPPNSTRDDDGSSTDVELSEGALRELFDHAPVGICRCDGSGRFLWVNPTLVRILGYGSAAELLAVDPAVDVFPTTNGGSALVERLHKLQSVRDFDVEWRRRDGTRISVVLNGRRVREREGHGLVFEMFVHDVTEKRAHEERLLQAQKLDALGRITGAIAHDFNNLLAAIVTPSEFLLEDLGTESPHWEDVSSINEAASRAADLTNQLLAFSRRRVLQPEPVRLGPLVHGMMRLLQRLAGEGVIVEVLVGHDLPPVLAEASQLEQVLVNLVVNARDALPHGGRIVIDATARGQLGEPVSPAEAYRVVLSVVDDGEGMDAETCKRVFDPFFTTKREGTGLGLATVAAIVKQHHGEIHVESEIGRGTRLQISLPVARGTKAAPPSGSVATEPTGGRILIVEDDPDVADLTRRALSRGGFDAAICGTGEVAVEQMRAGDVPDLLLVDMMLPGIDGLETARRARSIRSSVQIVYMSGYAGIEGTQRIERDRNALNLQKPFTVKQLLSTVNEALAKRPVDSD